MSAAPARTPRGTGSSAKKNTERSFRPNLEIVQRVRSAQRPLLLGLLTIGILGALFSLAALNAVLVAGQAELDAVNGQIEQTQRERARLEVRVAELSSPRVIIEQAERLGMVRASPPVHLSAVETPMAPAPEAPAAAEPDGVDEANAEGSGS